MRNLLGFLIKISPLLLFLLLEAVAVVLMVQRSKYHSYSIISSSNVISGSILDVSSSITSYFNLASVNEQLAKDNGKLMDEIVSLRAKIGVKQAFTDTVDSGRVSVLHIPARVIGGSVNKTDNFLTIDRGSNDGVKPDMGVVCGHGIVGIVSNSSSHYSVVMPVINLKSKISCRVGASNAIGSLVWDGVNPSKASLNDVPRHIKVAKGEKVYTSGFSYIFPDGIEVGTIEKVALGETGSFYDLTVRLSTSFYTLSEVDVVSFGNMDELKELENSINKKEP